MNRPQLSIRHGTLLMVVAAILAGCATVDRLNPFSRKSQAETALPFRAALRKEADGVLAVTVRAEGAGVNAVRESVR
jgi:hypothetical protein